MPEPRRRRTAYAADRRCAPSDSPRRWCASCVGGPGSTGFEASPFTDSYVKVVFVHPDVRPPAAAHRGRPGRRRRRSATTAPPEHAPRLRSYTVRAFDDATRELTLDFVVHGDEGVAGPWAASARPGDEVLLIGPGGGYAPDPAAGRHLLVGDLSALPAIAVALERLPADARGHVVARGARRRRRGPLSAPAGVELTWVHQGDAAPGARLVEAVPRAALARRRRAGVRARRGRRGEGAAPLPAARARPGAGPAVGLRATGGCGVDDEGWRAGKRRGTPRSSRPRPCTA